MRVARCFGRFVLKAWLDALGGLFLKRSYHFVTLDISASIDLFHKYWFWPWPPAERFVFTTQPVAVRC